MLAGVATIIEVTGSNDPRLRDYVSLRDTQLRQSVESERGLFIAEGALIIERAVEAGHEPISFLLAPRWLARLGALLEKSTAPCYLMSEADIECLTGFHVHRGALAAMRRAPERSFSDLFDAHRLVVCEDIVDHTNVGAIMRAAAGLGWDGVALAPRSADPLYRRAIKTSMGTVFSLPWARMDDWETGVAALRDAGFVVAALALSDDALTLDQFASTLSADTRLALLFGTEGEGLSDRWLSQADVHVTIPMSRGVDSLNVASAAAVACYTLAQGL